MHLSLGCHRLKLNVNRTQGEFGMCRSCITIRIFSKIVEGHAGVGGPLHIPVLDATLVTVKTSKALTRDGNLKKAASL